MLALTLASKFANTNCILFFGIDYIFTSRKSLEQGHYLYGQTGTQTLTCWAAAMEAGSFLLMSIYLSLNRCSMSFSMSLQGEFRISTHHHSSIFTVINKFFYHGCLVRIKPHKLTKEETKGNYPKFKGLKYYQ